VVQLSRSLYAHRELIGVLVAKQLKLRYRGSALGFLWTLLNPLIQMLVYTLVFNVYFRLDMERYPAFLFTGLLPWIWFSSSLQQGVTSILDGAGLVTRSQFPAEVLPVVTVTSNAVNFLLTLPLLLAFLFAFRVRVGTALFVLPLLVALEYVLVLGPVLMLAALDVHFRDLQHIVLHLLMILQFLTPIFYPLTLIPRPLRAWAFANPLTILVSSYQDVLYFNRLPRWLPLVGLFLVACVVLSGATAMFDRYKHSFAETL
jgi:lipopolysaccharide transport system permease protein